MDKVVGVLGGGQLGRMLSEAANRLNIKIITLDAENAPAKQINARVLHVNGSFVDPDAVRQLAAVCDIMTVEIEHVNTEVLQELATGLDTRQHSGSVVGIRRETQPNWRTIRTIQDKLEQKKYLQSHAIPTTTFQGLKEQASSDELIEIGEQFGYPFMLKSRTQAYDGRGNYPIKASDVIPDALAALHDRPLYAEKWANFRMELAVMVVKIIDDADVKWQASTLAYPVVETVHEESICKLVFAPARGVPQSVLQRAQDLARRAVAVFGGKGVFGVEMFWQMDDDLLINEIAPRPHNSGHYTIEACPLSQYDAHLRAILALPIPEEGVRLATTKTNAIMLNILGGLEPTSHLTMTEKALAIPGASIHLYGKEDARPGRKMGHVTLVADDMNEATSRMMTLIDHANLIREERLNPQPNPPHNKLRLNESPEVTNDQNNWKKPLVAVTMGSRSDSSVLAPGIKLLEQLEIPYSVTITSAHRTPDKMTLFAKEAAEKGVKVIIAAAGGAAHLPGMIAAITWLPVIGVPVRGNILDGQDSLLSIVQMPKGCPVATVAINNSINAAQLAARILATSDMHTDIRKRLKQHLADQTSSVLEDSLGMERLGFEAFCSQG